MKRQINEELTGESWASLIDWELSEAMDEYDFSDDFSEVILKCSDFGVCR